MKRLIVLAALLALAGCEEREVFSDKVNTYRLLNIDPPKHVYVDMQNIKTGEIFRHQYVGKHCNGWQKIKIGGLWDVHEVVYRYPESNRFTTSLVGLRAICP